MKTIIATALFATACRLPHVEPVHKTPAAAEQAYASVQMSCGSDIQPDKWASGVVISQKYILTAAHVVRCAGIPSIRVKLANGKELTAVVERDDQMFGAGMDLARLEIWGLETTGYAEPPVLGMQSMGAMAATATKRGLAFGRFTMHDVADMPTELGDSGSGVYNEDGELVGIVTNRSGDVTVFEEVGPYWLEGT